MDSSPVLPVGHYAYTMVIDISDVAPGSEVLCGQQVRPSAGKASGDYGIVDNTAGSVPISGHCALSGTLQTQARSAASTASPTACAVGGREVDLLRHGQRGQQHRHRAAGQPPQRKLQ